MKASYFKINATGRNSRTLWQVELSQLSQVARFVLGSEQYQTKWAAECSITITQHHVSSPNMSSVIDSFKADGVEKLRQLAQSVKQ